jgi:hypothetical protein
MALIDRECVRRLLESPDADATLVFAGGECQVLPESEVDDAHRPLIVARRSDLDTDDGPLTDERLDSLAAALDNRVRDLGS